MLQNLGQLCGELSLSTFILSAHNIEGKPAQTY